MRVSLGSRQLCSWWPRERRHRPCDLGGCESGPKKNGLVLAWGVFLGTTMCAGMPRSLAARARAPAWLPELCVTTPFRASSSDKEKTALQAPRNLKAPLQQAPVTSVWLLWNEPVQMSHAVCSHGGLTHLTHSKGNKASNNCLR